MRILPEAVLWRRVGGGRSVSFGGYLKLTALAGSAALLIQGKADADPLQVNPRAAPDALVQPLLVRDLVGLEGKEVLMETVKYPPGGSSPAHKHHAQVFVYVLAGTLRMQVRGSPVLTLRPGDTFYEGPDDEHVVSQNASDTMPAKFLVVMVRDKASSRPGGTS